MEIVLYKPTPPGKQEAAPTERVVYGLAPRSSSLSGKTVGLLWNAKVNADVYLERIRQRLAENYEGVRFVSRSKPSASLPMAPEVFEALRLCDAVVNAFGD